MFLPKNWKKNEKHLLSNSQQYTFLVFWWHAYWVVDQCYLVIKQQNLSIRYFAEKLCFSFSLSFDVFFAVLPHFLEDLQEFF